MNKREIKSLLKRYHDGDLSPEEKARLDEWYHGRTESVNWRWSKEDQEQTMLEVKRLVDIKLDGAKVRRLDTWIWKAAVILFAILGIGLLLRTYYGQLRDHFDPVIYAEQYVPAGKRMALTLSDGTTVNLNSCSRIKYPKKFNRDKREVLLLEGEAFFDVRHLSKPFIVNSKGTRTIVLGTSFNINSYNVKKNIEITVVTGKVGVQGHRNKKSIFLLPGQQVIFNKSIDVMVKKEVITSDIVGWTNGKYRFDNERLIVILNTLKNIFKVNISCSNDNLNEIRLTSKFDESDALANILFAICKANKLSYTIDKHNAIMINN